jgi:hypothetical protein
VRTTSTAVPESSLEVAELTGDGRGCRAGIEEYGLSFLHEISGGLCNAELLARVLEFAFDETAIGIG